MTMSQRTTKLTVLSQCESAPRISIKGRWKDSKKDAEGPGPGAYTPQPEKIKYPSKSAQIQGRYSTRSNTLGPGPGQYYQGDKTLGGSQFSFGSSKRLSGRLHHQSPGPGSYAVKGLSKGPSVKLGERGRSSLGTVGGPGPGTYIPTVANNQIFESAPQVGFGTSVRSLVNKMKSPGPGHYGKNIGFESTAPKYSMKARYDKKSTGISLTPGPGTTLGTISSFG